MKVKITSPTRVDGQHLAAGRIISVSGEDGALLIAAQKAVRFIEPPKPQTKPDPSPAPVSDAPPSPALEPKKDS